MSGQIKTKLIGQALSRGMSRRGFIAGSAGFLAASAASAATIATPAQTQGPFYPLFKPIDADADLTLLKGATAPAEGEVIEVTGRVLSLKGHALPGVVVEIWQADAKGHYNHVLDAGGRRDKNFQGFGAVRSGADGGYLFRTIRPRFYDTGFGVRAPHIHFYVNAAEAGELTTQMYFVGDRYLESDFIFQNVPRAERYRVMVERQDPGSEFEPETGLYNFDLTVRPTT